MDFGDLLQRKNMFFVKISLKKCFTTSNKMSKFVKNQKKMHKKCSQKCIDQLTFDDDFYIF